VVEHDRTPSPVINSGTRLAAMVRPVLDDAAAVAAELSQCRDVRALYPRWLRQLHGVVRADVPLLDTAEREATRRGSAGDVLAAELVAHYEARSVDHLHHDEWVLADYAALGLDPHQLLIAVPSTTVATTVGAIYYWVLHFHPVALLGYLAATDATPPAVELIDEWRRRGGYPSSAFHTLRHQAVAHGDRSDEMRDLVDQLALADAHFEVVGRAAVHTARSRVALLRELRDGPSDLPRSN
jgi:hypothetical protein